MSNTLEKHYLIRFLTKSGKIKQTLSALGKAMLEGNALFNAKDNLSQVVFSAETGEIVFYLEGAKPHKEFVGRNIEDLCKGLLKALNEED